ncbi:Hypothetical predicted protein [Mytilus galloprovincialis]|uniref:C1q domain-containing protein n=2 Tax=Mytilus galloprovincialis TaxID=29158 RepID=A0A8B6E1B5_MYTGA|nr:Hypothetical predicted protein [Mytilus galloprovincialis]
MFLMLCLVSVVTMVLTIPYTVLARPCSSKDCLEVRMPLQSDNLKAPLIAELDVSTMNQQLKEYIDDSINYTFTHNVEKEDLKWKNNITGYFESVIDLKMLNLERRISEQSKASENLPEVVREHTQKACEGQMRSDGRIQFTSVKSSHGISMISSYRDGKFIAPKAGFYLVLSNILSNSQQGFFIRKNGTEIAMAWSHHRDLNTISLYNAPLLAFTELSVNDVITIEGQSLDHSSCLTIVQL